MNNQENALIISIMVGLALLGVIFGVTVGENAVRRDAIKHGAAYYHPQTGAFTWNAHPTKLEEIK